MSSDISRLIKNTPITSLQKYFAVVHNGLTADVAWGAEGNSVKKSLLNIADGLTGEKFALLKSNAERVNALTDELGQSILKHSV